MPLRDLSILRGNLPEIDPGNSCLADFFLNGWLLSFLGLVRFTMKTSEKKTTPVCGEGAMHQAFHVYYHLMFTVTEFSFHRHYSSRGRQSQLDPAEAGFELGVVSPEPWFHFVTSSTGVYLRKTLWQPKLQTLRDPGSSRSIVLAQSLNTLALNPESAKETHPGSGT